MEGAANTQTNGLQRERPALRTRGDYGHYVGGQSKFDVWTMAGAAGAQQSEAIRANVLASSPQLLHGLSRERHCATALPAVPLSHLYASDATQRNRPVETAAAAVYVWPFLSGARSSVSIPSSSSSATTRSMPVMAARWPVLTATRGD